MGAMKIVKGNGQSMNYRSTNERGSSMSSWMLPIRKMGKKI